MDELIPDLAPNLYSQGKVGTGYAQVFDTGAPNPFAVTQDYINQSIANKKEFVKKSVENEEARQQKLDDFLASIDDLDQPWNVAKVELGKKIDDYGDLIATKRAQGTSINSAQLTKAQKELKELSKVNNANYQKAMKINVEMQDPLIYTDEEREAFDKEIKEAADQKDASGNPIDGGIYEVQKVLDKWQKGVETPNVADDYKKIFKAQKQDQTAYLSKTPQANFEAAVKSQLDSYKLPQLKKLFVQYDAANRLPDDIDISDLESTDEKIKNKALDAIETQMREDLTPYIEIEKTAASRGGGGGGGTKKTKPVIPTPYQEYQTSGGDESLAISDSTGKTYNLIDKNGQSIGISPLVLTMISGVPGYTDGYYIKGTRTARKSDKAFSSEQEAQNSPLYDAASYVETSADGKVYIMTTKDEWIPLTDKNNSLFFNQSEGVDLIENYKKLLGKNYYNVFEKGSSGSKGSGNANRKTRKPAPN